MPYDDYEVLGGEPIELFKFTYGTTEWFWTSGAEEIDKDGDTYTPAAIVSGRVSADEEAQAGSVEVTIQGDNPIAVLFRNGQSFTPIFVSIFRKQRDDAEFATPFRGEVAVCSFGDANASLTCTPTQAVTQRKLAVLKYQPTCNNRLGDSRCQVDMEDWTWDYVISAITLGENEANYELGGDALAFFSGDALNWLSHGTVTFGDQVLMIEFHVGDNISTLGIFDDLIVGDTVTVKAGCDKLVATCRDKFDNLPRHQGFPYLPTANPAGDTIGAGFPNFGNPF